MHKCLPAIAALILPTSATALDISANGGLNSEYIFRGVPQSDGKATAFGGLDLEHAGFYLGTWASTVDSSPPVPVVAGPAMPTTGTNGGLEVDLYGGYGNDLGDFSYGIGGTVYTYTDHFDDEYRELNLSAGWKWFSADAAFGEYDNFDEPRQNYQFYAINAGYNGLYATIGIFADDFDGNYYEAGYGSTLSVGDTELFDYSLSLIYSDKTLLGGDDDLNLVARISRKFNLFSSRR